jgi:FkbM family methyltransferase
VAENSQRAATKPSADIWSAALSSIPLFPGKVRVTDLLARIAAITGGGWGTRSLGNDATIRLDLSDRIERQMWGGCYEPHVQRSLRALLQPGDGFVDVGAHVGYHSVLGSALVGPQGRVFAFEADPKNFARLADHLRPFGWAAAMNKAVWSNSGSVTFERSSQAGESGWGTLTAVRTLEKGDHISVDTVSLDDWSRENSIPNISMMKVDAEGSEVSIIRGAQVFLRRNRPVVIIEANDVVLRQAKTSALELAEILRETGYELFELGATTLQSLPVGMSPQSSELLAVPVERTEKSLTKLRDFDFQLTGGDSDRGKIQ